MAHTSHKDQDYYDLGTYCRSISTSSTEAQTWFNRGLIWTYAFNHEAAVNCFERAISLDHNCAIAYWGLAYALGPNYNKPWEVFDEQELDNTLKKTYSAAETARQVAQSADTSPVERALANAICSRYPERTPSHDRSEWNPQYASAMQAVYRQFPNDLDVAALYADSLMNITPWALWDLHTGEPAPEARTLEIKDVLDRAFTLAGGLEHPGLLHLYIHLMEMSKTPEIAMPIADRLRGLVPDGGHLNHMPSHLDILCGDYRRAIVANSDAIRSDEKYLAKEGPMNFYTLYRCHDYHFRLYAAMFAGQSAVALETAIEIENNISEEVLRLKYPPMADWLEGLLGMRLHVLIRFGRWQDVIDLPMPTDQELYCVTTAMLHYAKGVALAVIGRLPEAEQERTLFRESVTGVKPSRTIFNNKCTDILAVAGAMLDGELEYRRGNINTAFEHLHKSLELDDNLPFDEPWGWMQPVRHAYGALLLEQGHVEPAANLYKADLGFDDTVPRARHHPNNVWSLHGYHECLTKLGRTAEASIIGQQLKIAMAMADVPIKSSCFCRRASGIKSIN